MNQRDFNRAVADATGESVDTIAQRGFLGKPEVDRHEVVDPLLRKTLHGIINAERPVRRSDPMTGLQAGEDGLEVLLRVCLVLDNQRLNGAGVTHLVFVENVS